MKVVVMIDGGHLRVLARRQSLHYDPDLIERAALNCVAENETLLRVLYYDCAPYKGSAKNPVSGTTRVFNASDEWLENLAAKNLFAVRRGVLKFRGFKPRNTPINKQDLTDADFAPDFEQKGVDMRIGLDIAVFSQNHTIDRIILCTNDTDCVPAMKHGRKCGIQIVLAKFPMQQIPKELTWHSDIVRDVIWKTAPL